MERNFDRDDFELFLQQKTDQYKMYPSDSVWRAIYRNLHTKRRGFIIGGSLLLLCCGYFLSQQFITDKKITAQINGISSGFGVDEQQPVFFTDIIKRLSKKTSAVETNNTIDLKAAEAIITAKVISITTAPNQQITSAKNSTNPVIENEVYQKATSINSDRQAPVISINKSIENLPDPALFSEERKLVKSLTVAETKDEMSWLKKIALDQYKLKRLNRFALQFYFSPTISFRTLEGQSKNVTPTPLAIQEVDVNRYVNQTPAMGIEIGSTVMYNASKNITFKAGLQMNFTRYNIQAFRYDEAKTTIVLNNNNVLRDTISTYSSLRNMGGYQAEQIQNQYLQIAVPIGAEIKLLGNKRLQFNIAGTIQPSYLLANKSYLLSNDYTSYTEESSLIRRWNVSTNLETYFSYQSGGVRWQIGPQFRYQLMSSYKNVYPIREYLMEYGIKFGVSKTIR